MWNRKIFAGSLAMVVLVLIALLLQTSVRGVSGNAFAEVQAALAKIKSIRYKETRTDGKSQSQIDSQRKGGKSAPQGDGSQVSRRYILGRYQSRTESLDRNSKPLFVSIVNTSTGEHVSLDAARKRFTSLNRQVVIHKDGTKKERDITAPNLEVDFYRQISQVPEDAVTKVPPKQIHGRKALGYTVTKRAKRDTWTRTYWVDAKTKLPVRVEIKVSSTDPSMAPSQWVLSDFVFGEKLDASLFSTAPPAGYTVVSDKAARKIHGLSNRK